MQVDEFTAEYKLELPFRPHGSLLYWFCEKPDVSDPEQNRLNFSQDVLHLPPKTGSGFNLRIRFDPEYGLLTPTFIVGNSEITGAAFPFGGLRLSKEVHSFTGVDFGTSNSYAVNVWATPIDKFSRYPKFSLSNSAGERLRKTELAIQKAREDGVLNGDSAKEYSKREQANFIFHSIKIEGSSLTRGETEALLEGREPVRSKEAIEPLNVRDAYEFCMCNTEYLEATPELFMRELHKMVLKDISIDGGVYRRETVTLSGMTYSPPDWVDVEPFMAQLASEIKHLDRSKSVLQHAAEVHSKFTSIHPFSDGNGRTARLIMNAVLMEAGLPSIVIAHSDKQRYLDGLVSSNNGDISELSILFAECLEASLADMAGQNGAAEELVDLQAMSDAPVVAWVPGDRLAAIMKTRVDSAPVSIRNRYDAWVVAFDSFREDFRLTCEGFNNLYAEALYKAELSGYDRLPYEKYEELLRQKPVSKSWLMGLALSSMSREERFVFWFSPVTDRFLEACAKFDPRRKVPPRDVSISISRRVDGSFQPLREEPIQVREIAYVGGDWVVLIYGQDQTFRIEQMSVLKLADLFLVDAISTYL